MMSPGDESVLGAEEDHVCFYDNVRDPTQVVRWMAKEAGGYRGVTGIQRGMGFSLLDQGLV